MDIVRVERSDFAAVAAAGHLFDYEPRPDRIHDFLGRPGHHLLIASTDGIPAGFVTGIEIAHPDKDVEMLLYELGVDEAHRRRGIGTALVAALRDLAAERGCRGMWVPAQPGDEAATRTYLAAGAGPVEEAGIQSWEFGPS